MTRSPAFFVGLVLAIAGTLPTCAHAQAQEEPNTFDISPKFRARIAKEKSKQAAIQASNGSANGSNSAGSPQCGSQNIGNIDTNGRTGSAPREVFVFAPNAINTVNNGCN